MVASSIGNTKLVKELLSNGANLDLQSMVRVGICLLC